MKRIIATLFATLVAAAALLGQTPEEIIARMDQEMDRFEKDGMSMVMEMKIILVGTVSATMYSVGDKYMIVTEMKDEKSIEWSDGVTEWEYDVKKNQITITNKDPNESSDAEDNKQLIDSVTSGYDVKLRSQTPEVWNFRCTKSRNNPNKDDPKSMDLVVSKATYLPVSIKASVFGATVTLRDFTAGVTEEQVTFDPAMYPDAVIIDKR